MKEVSPCEGCPVGKLDNLSVFFDTRVRAKVLEIVHKQQPSEQEFFMMMLLVNNIFGGAEITTDTAWQTQQCIQAVWDMGKRHNGCMGHPLTAAYQSMGLEGCCLRKYMLSETLKFISGLWEESGKNEEQFQALMRDRWIIHQMAFAC